jgi:hypothetical protein
VDTLRLETRRSAVDRSFGLIVGLFALPIAIDVAMLVFVVSHDAGELAALAFLVPLVLLTLLELTQCYQWGATRALEWLLWVSDAGLVFFTPRGRVELPWEAVTGVGIGQVLWTQQLTVWVQAGPGSPGVVSTVPAATWRVIRRRGLRLSLRLVHLPPADVAEAISAFSRGRCAPAAVA